MTLVEALVFLSYFNRDHHLLKTRKRTITEIVVAERLHDGLLGGNPEAKNLRGGDGLHDRLRQLAAHTGM